MVCVLQSCYLSCNNNHNNIIITINSYYVHSSGYTWKKNTFLFNCTAFFVCLLLFLLLFFLCTKDTPGCMHHLWQYFRFLDYDTWYQNSTSLWSISLKCFTCDRNPLSQTSLQIWFIKPPLTERNWTYVFCWNYGSLSGSLSFTFALARSGFERH